MNHQEVIWQFLNNQWDAGDAFTCLQHAIMLEDAECARKAGMRCYDLARRLESSAKKDPANVPRPETMPMPKDWQAAVADIRSGIPNSAMVAEIQPSGNPGELASDPIYTWGGGRWTIIGDRVFCWNKLLQEWQESTLLPEQLRADGTLIPTR